MVPQSPIAATRAQRQRSRRRWLCLWHRRWPGPVLTPGYASRPGPGYAYGTGYMAGPPHAPGGTGRAGNLCWSDKDAWANTGQGYWKAC